MQLKIKYSKCLGDDKYLPKTSLRIRLLADEAIPLIGAMNKLLLLRLVFKIGRLPQILLCRIFAMTVN